jgi:RNA polymerase sigma-70 factor, ECF subfamily
VAVQLVINTWSIPHLLPALSEQTGAARSRETGSADEALMQSYQRGNEEAFRKLYERHRSALLRYIRRTAPTDAEVEEIAQETWMAVIKGRESYRSHARFVAWLFSMDRWRRRGRTPGQEPDNQEPDLTEGPVLHEPDWQAGNAALGAALLAAVSSLPLLQREAFLLRAEGGLGVDEIAQITGTSRETAKSRLRYATRRLRIALVEWA